MKGNGRVAQERGRIPVIHRCIFDGVLQPAADLAMRGTKEIWNTVCPICAAPLPPEVALCPSCGGRTLDVEQLLKEAEGKYSREAKFERMKKDFRDSWLFLVMPFVYQFLLLGPGLLAVLVLRKTDALRDSVSFFGFAAFWFVSIVAGICLVRVEYKLQKLIAERNKLEE
jgi:hypothetical protein